MAKKKIKLLRTVALNDDLSGRKLKRGEVGTVVEVLARDVYEVEFCDEDGQRMRSWHCGATSSHHCTIKGNRLSHNRKIPSVHLSRLTLRRKTPTSKIDLKPDSVYD